MDHADSGPEGAIRSRWLPHLVPLLLALLLVVGAYAVFRSGSFAFIEAILVVDQAAP